MLSDRCLKINAYTAILMFGNSIKKIQKKKMFERKIEQNVQKKERNARVNDKNNKGITRRQAESVLYFTYLFLLNSRVFCYKFFFVPFFSISKTAQTRTHTTRLSKLFL